MGCGLRILATGGAGYVGSHCVRWLERAGHEVWVYDNLSRGHRQFAKPDRLIVGDLSDQERLRQTLVQQQIDVVIHFAAFALVSESMSDPALYYRNNTLGSFSLLEAMRQAGVTRIVISSTTAVFGNAERVPIVEDEPKQPCNPYGQSKLMVEQLLAEYARAYGMAATAFRFFNAAGATPHLDCGEWHDPETHLIPIVLSVAQGHRSQMTIFGNDYPTPDGTCVRDYVHVDDLAAAHLAALERLRPGVFQSYNLGIGRGYSNLEVVEACRRVTGKEIPITFGPRRAGDPPTLIADSTRARRELQWQPAYTDLDAIVATAWAWHQKHPESLMLGR